MRTPRPASPMISVVVPVLDEQGCVDELARRIRDALAGCDVRAEILFVDDGSRDETPARIHALRAADPAIKSIRFTRSFGHQAALMGGLAHARGDAVVTMDGDLQHPPELLPAMLAAWRAGADVVHTVRHSTPEQNSGISERASRAFYRLMNATTGIEVVPAGADFRLLDRAAVDALNALPERSVFLRGLVPWLGFRETRLPYEVARRFAGASKYSLSKMVRLALDGILSFSMLPLRLITGLGIVTSLFALVYGLFALTKWLVVGIPQPGWASLMIVALLFGGVQLVSIGLLAEYVGRTYEEVKRRPRFVIESTEGID